MCMECDYKFARKSQKDIHVWKVFEKIGERYRTPWYDAYVDAGCNVIVAHSNSLSAYDDFSGVHNIEDQGVHAFTDKKYAEWQMQWLCNDNKEGEYVVLPAVILKGTFYWENIEGHIAAKKIIVDLKTAKN